MILNTQQLSGKSDTHITLITEHVGIHKDMLLAWQSLYDAALINGFNLKIASGYRNFDRQLSIWNRKFSGELTTKNKLNEAVDITHLSDSEKVDAILVYSALPGTSRHHWGTDIDIYADNLLLENQKLQLEPWEYQQGGPFEALSIWLKQHAKTFGFFLPYDKDRGGVAVEPWHLSYAPLAQPCLCNMTIETLTQTIEQSNILGKEAILNKLPHILSQYVHNINKGS
jgi:LAS superfamily LD-carboxypeptidase LdcB